MMKFINFVNVTKDDRDITTVVVASMNCIMDSLIESKDGILMSGNSKEASAKTIASNLIKERTVRVM